MNQYIPTLTIFSGVIDLLKGMTLADNFGGGQAFADVKSYARENLVAGLQEMYLYDDRICLLIPTRWSHTREQQGLVMITTRTLEFVAMITDRNYGQEGTAFLGEAGVNPGALQLAEMVTTALTGQTLGMTKVCLVPEGGEPFRLSPADRDAAAARECWAQTFTTYAGEFHTHLRRSPRASAPAAPGVFGSDDPAFGSDEPVFGS